MKTKSYMPICLDLSGEKCLVVGGGNVALRKINVLLQFGAKVTCISPALVRELDEIRIRRGISHLKARYTDRVSLKPYRLVIAATDDPKVNRRIASRARLDRVIVNVVDGSSSGSFIMPAIIKKRDITVGVSTGGVDPARAKKVRDIIRDAI